MDKCLEWYTLGLIDPMAIHQQLSAIWKSLSTTLTAHLAWIDDYESFVDAPIPVAWKLLEHPAFLSRPHLGWVFIVKFRSRCGISTSIQECLNALDMPMIAIRGDLAVSGGSRWKTSAEF